jgi:hypothetical protein
MTHAMTRAITHLTEPPAGHALPARLAGGSR